MLGSLAVRMVRGSVYVGSIAVAGSLLATTTLAGDGGGGTSPWHEYVTYYQEILEYYTREELEAHASGIPSSLHLEDTDDSHVEYAQVGPSEEGIEWIVRLRPLYRTHEKVDAIYHMILILPLPAGADGGDAFTPLEDVQVWQGDEESFEPLIYGGERVLGKRNEVLEETLLPALVGAGTGQIPSLEDTGYTYTVWDAILRYDPDFGERVGGFTTFRYRTDTSVAAPDPGDDRMKGYVITWIPAFGDAVPPYTVRIDVEDPALP